MSDDLHPKYLYDFLAVDAVDRNGAPLVYQKQPGDMGCTHACVAMLAGVPVDEVIEQYPVEVYGDSMGVLVLAAQYRIALRHIPPEFLPYIPALYLLGFRDEQGMHAALIRVTWDTKTTKNVEMWDPLHGYLPAFPLDCLLMYTVDAHAVLYAPSDSSVQSE